MFIKSRQDVLPAKSRPTPPQDSQPPNDRATQPLNHSKSQTEI